MNLATLAQQVRQTQDEAERRGLALDLLGRSRRREHVDAALRALEGCDLDDMARPLLRERTLFYFEKTQRDNGALIREQLLLLLLRIGNYIRKCHKARASRAPLSPCPACRT